MTTPGGALLERHNDGAVTVVWADPVIRVSVAVLLAAEPWVWRDGVLTLDTAGEYRYIRRGLDPDDPERFWIFERTGAQK